MRFLFPLFVLLSCHAATAQINVAVASNFKHTLTEIVALYTQQTGEKVVISSASTGMIYNQITRGAPFDLFLSADSERAKMIEHSKFGVTGSRFTYAQGLLAFWLPDADVVELQSLLNYQQRLAIANPKLAPYGLAAKQTLENVNLWNKLSYIKGTNVAQTYQFIESGNVHGGLVAYSLLLQNKQSHYFVIPNEYHQAILQQGVVLEKSEDKERTQKFIDFLMSKAIQALIAEKGYL